ncbi:Protein of unknown function, partial [Phyllobacterium sp. CL33Tsu]
MHRGQKAPLSSWSDGDAKARIIDFVKAVTTEGNADFVDLDNRIAVFDNDGTLWGEQPMYVQLAFVLDRVKALAPQHPEWQTTEPFKSVLSGDLNGVAASGERGLVELVAATHAGMTSEEFSKIVADWIAKARHPKLDKPYTSLIFQPMLEVIDYLKQNGFKVFIVSGGGIELGDRLAELQQASKERTELKDRDDGAKEVILGSRVWPFPFPLVKHDAGWQFDT